MEKLLGRRISVVRYIGVLVACVASVSARVRRENWDKSKKRGMRGRGVKETLRRLGCWSYGCSLYRGSTVSLSL